MRTRKDHGDIAGPVEQPEAAEMTPPAAEQAEAADTAPPVSAARPTGGGRWVRQPDGSLVRHTEKQEG